MAINWRAYDHIPLFEIYQAAYLWVEMEPIHRTHAELVVHLDPGVEQMMVLIIENTGGHYCKGTPILMQSCAKRRVTRQSLIQMAQKLGEKPKFLFPETRDEDEGKARNKADVKSIADVESIVDVKSMTEPALNRDKPLDPRKKKTYLLLIMALCKKSGIDFNERAVSKTLVGMINRIGGRRTEATIREILEELKALERELEP
ncbi:hypothetical protein DO97_03705 [Neosynechococcus sphagnicola sy1]|uniref:Uncharacterized protein n=1 Tax=Neosynechococcus sphagnicola sy1 TaxID=1497020 RepID=A0A098TKI2_9CYAN|nr:hypothetical protein [Neosynechococcus sphagnicola]KGF72845.1 hypothetical protein DO97_03705 [Neosynechococcus sphagnicola sy1]